MASPKECSDLQLSPEKRMAMRQLAELRLASLPEIPSANQAALLPQAIQHLLHELQVHQIELEMQNAELRLTQSELDTSRARYFDFYDLAPVGYCSVGEKGLIRQANMTTAAILGTSRDVLLGQPFSRFILPENQDSFYNFRRQLLDTRQCRSCELRLRLVDGSTFWAQLAALAVPDDDGSTVLRLVLSDITERRTTEEARKQSEAYVHTILDSVFDEIAVVDQHGVITAVNARWRRFAKKNSLHPGLPANHADVGTNYLEACRGGADSESSCPGSATEGIQGVLDGQLPTFSLEYLCNSPEQQRWFRMRVTPLDGQNGGAVIAHTDITEVKRLEEELHQLAFFDTLTGLPNRRLLNDRLSKAMSASKRSGRYGALMMLDIDNFKPLNDEHGHDAGDTLLIDVASRLIECVRDTDTVARVGGDEFVVMLCELTADESESSKQAVEVAEKIRASLAAPYQLMLNEGGLTDSLVEHHCTVSIGVVIFYNHDAAQSSLLKQADSAMYQAKASGRNAIRFQGVSQPSRL